MNVAPTARRLNGAIPPSGPTPPQRTTWVAKRRGATCDARNTAATAQYPAAPPQRPNTAACMRPPSGRHECRPYGPAPQRYNTTLRPDTAATVKRGGATCDARYTAATAQCPRNGTPPPSGTIPPQSLIKQTEPNIITHQSITQTQKRNRKDRLPRRPAPMRSRPHQPERKRKQLTS